MTLIRTVRVGVLMLATASPCAAACLAYEPASVTLTGRLAAAEGVASPGAMRLVLDRPACTAAGAGAPGEARVASIGLVFLRGVGLPPNLIGRRVAVSGSLFHAPAKGGDGPVMLTVAGVGRAR